MLPVGVSEMTFSHSLMLPVGVSEFVYTGLILFDPSQNQSLLLQLVSATAAAAFVCHVSGKFTNSAQYTGHASFLTLIFHKVA